MGCGDSKQGSRAPVEEIPEMDLSGLDNYQKFEYQLPFYRTRIDIFEGRVKRFVNGKNSVTLQQLRYAFKDDKKWSDLFNEDSVLCQILESEFFEDEKNQGEINIHALILWGLLLCPGDNKLKARVLYDVLQDSLQPTISANDKDFRETFDKLVSLATKLPYTYHVEFNGGQPTNSDKINDDLLETLAESFLDEVFGSLAKLPRNEYMQTVATKQNWIFNPKEIRSRVEKA